MSNLFKLPRDGRVVGEALASSASVTEQPHSNTKLDLQAILAEEVHLKPESRLAFYSDPRSCAADRYRYLRMRLREARLAGKMKALLITSPIPEDGKSTTCINLATALADSGKSKVLLIEADLHHSPLLEMLGLEPSPGLAECLESGFDVGAAIRRLQPLGWYLLPAGNAHDNPTELLQTETLSHVLDKLVACFDWVLIDSPPVMPLVDALLLKRHTDATLLIARGGHTPRSAIERSLTLIGREHVFGVILNAVEGLGQLYSKYSAYYYQSTGSKSKKSK